MNNTSSKKEEIQITPINVKGAQTNPIALEWGWCTQRSDSDLILPVLFLKSPYRRLSNTGHPFDTQHKIHNQIKIAISVILSTLLPWIMMMAPPTHKYISTEETRISNSGVILFMISYEIQEKWTFQMHRKLCLFCMWFHYDSVLDGLLGGTAELTLGHSKSPKSLRFSYSSGDCPAGLLHFRKMFSQTVVPYILQDTMMFLCCQFHWKISKCSI